MVKSTKDLNIGDEFITNEGGSVTVINISNWKSITVMHNNIRHHTTTVIFSDLIKGKVKNPFKPRLYGVGYMGVGVYTSNLPGSSTLTPEYTAWSHMLGRCYDIGFTTKNTNYANCTVCIEWHNFQVFAHWYRHTGYYNIGYELDKDILVEGNRIYSPSTCCMVPREINQLFKNINKTTNLPRGVNKHGRRYRTTYCGVRYGSYETIQEANEVYICVKRTHLLNIAARYKDIVDIRVYYSLYALAYTF